MNFIFFLDLLGCLVLNFLCGIVTLFSSLVYYIVAKTRNSKNRNLKRSSGKPIPRKQNPKSKKPRPTVSASFKKYRDRKMETPYHLTPEYINGVKSGLIEVPEDHPFQRHIKAIKSLDFDDMEAPEEGRPLRKSPRCAECKKFLADPSNGEPKSDEVKELQKCSNCNIVQYCSRECQRKNWNIHKEPCQAVVKLQDEIHMMSIACGFKSRPITAADINYHRACNDHDELGDEVHGVCRSYTVNFETRLGDPWFKLLWKKHCLAFAYWNMAQNSNSYPVYEILLSWLDECLAASMFGFCELQSMLLFTLAAMGKHKEAFYAAEMLLYNFFLMGPEQGELADVLNLNRGWEERVKLQEQVKVMPIRIRWPEGLEPPGREEFFYLQVKENCQRCLNYPWYEACLAILAFDKFMKVIQINKMEIALQDSLDRRVPEFLQKSITETVLSIYGVTKSEKKAFDQKRWRQLDQFDNTRDVFQANEVWKFIKDLIPENNAGVVYDEDSGNFKIGPPSPSIPVPYQSFDEYLAELKTDMPKTRASQIWRIISPKQGFLEFLKTEEKIDEDLDDDADMKIRAHEISKKYLINPSSKAPWLQGVIESWKVIDDGLGEWGWGYVRAEGEAEILGNIQS